MIVLVDTPIWSLAFRRKTASAPQVKQLADLINRSEAVIIGPIRQEVLSGIRAPGEFSRVRRGLRAFSDVRLGEEHYELAAEFFNLGRSHGIQGSNTDFLICAVADLHDMAIFTTDRDFQHFAKHLPVRLYSA
jgi:predicted nucleic acid-binding protein